MPRRLTLVMLVVAACGDDSGGSSVDGAVDLIAASPCSDASPPPGSVCPLEVTGQFVDDAGLALDKVVVSVCAGLCFYGTTDAMGNFKVDVDSHIVVSDFAFEAHGRPDAVSYYTALPSGTGPSLVYSMLMPLVPLPASGTEILADGSQQTVTGDDITLQIPAMTKVRFSVEDFGVPHGHELRTVHLVTPTAVPFGTTTPPLVAMYGLSPFEAAFDHKVALSIVNRTGLGGNAPVEILVQSGLLNDKPPAGAMVHAANGHVSADAATITTDAGEGIVELTWIGIRGL